MADVIANVADGIATIHIITEKNYQEHLHVNRFVDTKAIQVAAAWFGCNISLDNVENMSFQDRAKYILLKPQLLIDYCYIIYECGECYKMLNPNFFI